MNRGREPEEKPWDQRILELLPSGVDETLLAENLRLTPDERVRNMISALASIEAMRSKPKE